MCHFSRARWTAIFCLKNAGVHVSRGNPTGMTNTMFRDCPTFFSRICIFFLLTLSFLIFSGPTFSSPCLCLALLFISPYFRKFWLLNLRLTDIFDGKKIAGLSSSELLLQNFVTRSVWCIALKLRWWGLTPPPLRVHSILQASKEKGVDGNLCDRLRQLANEAQASRFVGSVTEFVASQLLNSVFMNPVATARHVWIEMMLRQQRHHDSTTSWCPLRSCPENATCVRLHSALHRFLLVFGTKESGATSLRCWSWSGVKCYLTCSVCGVSQKALTDLHCSHWWQRRQFFLAAYAFRWPCAVIFHA